MGDNQKIDKQIGSSSSGALDHQSDEDNTDSDKNLKRRIGEKGSADLKPAHEKIARVGETERLEKTIEQPRVELEPSTSGFRSFDTQMASTSLDTFEKQPSKDTVDSAQGQKLKSISLHFVQVKDEMEQLWQDLKEILEKEGVDLEKDASGRIRLPSFAESFQHISISQTIAQAFKIFLRHFFPDDVQTTGMQAGSTSLDTSDQQPSEDDLRQVQKSHLLQQSAPGPAEEPAEMTEAELVQYRKYFKAKRVALHKTQEEAALEISIISGRNISRQRVSDFENFVLKSPRIHIFIPLFRRWLQDMDAESSSRTHFPSKASSYNTPEF